MLGERGWSTLRKTNRWVGERSETNGIEWPMGGTEKGGSASSSVRATKTVFRRRQRGEERKEREGRVARGNETAPMQRREGGRKIERARAIRKEKGWSTLRVIRSRPSRAPLYPPRLYIPRPCNRRVRASVCAVVKTHTSKARTSLGAAGRRATPHGVGVASSTDSFLSLRATFSANVTGRSWSSFAVLALRFSKEQRDEAGRR